MYAVLRVPARDERWCFLGGRVSCVKPNGIDRARIVVKEETHDSSEELKEMK
jgi:hypothetical protein